jgi:hypothetical protein
MTKTSKQPNMRGWGRIKIGSTRLSDFARMRKTTAICFGHMKDIEKCMWEITVRFPPSKKVGER